MDVDPRLDGGSSEVAEQTEAGDVGGPGRARVDGYPSRFVVEPCGGGDHLPDQGVGGLTGLDGRGCDPDAERLGEHDVLAGSEPGVGQHLVGMHLTDHGETELRLGVVDGVATGDHEAGGAGDLLGPDEHVAEKFGGQFVVVPADKVQRQQRAAAHRVHVRHRVGRGDPTPRRRIVDEGGDEVGGHHQGPVVVETPDGRVVTGGGVDEEAGIVVRGETAQHVGQLARGELARSTRAVTELRESSSHRGVTPLLCCS